MRELEPAWRELWLRTESTPFQSPDWLLPWWKNYGDGKLMSFAFWSGDALVGLAPLYRYRAGADPKRRVFLLGTGNTDYLDLLVRAEFRAAFAEAVLSELAEASDEWDVCDFQQLREDSPFLKASSALPVRFRRQEVCPVLELDSQVAENPMLDRSRGYRRKLEREHYVSFRCAGLETLTESFESLIRLHEGRWKARGLPGVLADARDQRFHFEAARGFLNSGALRFYTIALEGEIAATLYGFCHRKRMYFYLSGFDPCWARFSLGQVILGHAVEEALREGCEIFDFLRGGEAYKYQWGAFDQLTFRGLIERRVFKPAKMP